MYAVSLIGWVATTKMRHLTVLSIIISCCALYGCDSFEEQGIDKNISLEESIIKLSVVDFDDLYRRTVLLSDTSAVRPSLDDYIGILTAEERAAFELFSYEISHLNNKEFVSVYGGDFARLFNESDALVLLKEAGATSCPAIGSSHPAGSVSKAPCDLECASYLVAMAAMYASVGGGPVTMALAVAGFALAGESVARCLSANNMDTCW